MRNPQKLLFSAAVFMAPTLALGQAGTAWAAGGSGGHAGGKSSTARTPVGNSASAGSSRSAGHPAPRAARAAGGTGAQAADQPPGNDGTVKVDEYSMDPGQDNDPHVSCGFSISFYGYDGGPQSASITVTPVAPTAGGGSYTTSTSWDVGTRTGGSQFDHNVSVNGADLSSALTGVTPQAQQGYHLRLEVEVSGSQGSDDKYKVFWLQPCAPVTSPGLGSGSGSGSRSKGGPGSPGTPSGGGTPAGGSSGSSGADTPVGAASATVAASSGLAASTPTSPRAAVSAGASRPAAVTGAPPSGGSLAFTGFDLAGMVAAGLGLIGAGAFITERQRRNGRLARRRP